MALEMKGLAEGDEGTEGEGLGTVWDGGRWPPAGEGVSCLSGLWRPVGVVFLWDPVDPSGG